jgi:ferredoxin
MPMRVSVDENRCQGHTLCAMAAPDLFDLREDDGHSVVKVEEVPTSLEGAVRRAVESCPERAISITD